MQPQATSSTSQACLFSSKVTGTYSASTDNVTVITPRHAFAGSFLGSVLKNDVGKQKVVAQQRRGTRLRPMSVIGLATFAPLDHASLQFQIQNPDP